MGTKRGETVRLRIRFYEAALLVFVLVAGAAYYAFDVSLVDLDSLVDAATARRRPVTRLIREIGQARLDAHYFLMRADEDRFQEVLLGLDATFDEALATPGLAEEETRRIKKARREWQAAVKRLLGVHGEESRLPPLDTIKTFDAGASLAVEYLEQVRDIVQEDIDQEIALAHGERDRLKVRMLIIIALVFGVGLVFAMGMVRKLSHSVALHVRDIREGAERFGDGDFSYRIPPGEHDELGEVADCFNEMAEHLEHHSRALVEMSMRDRTTGLYNRGEFLRVLRSERERGRRYRRPFAIAVIRFDNWVDVVHRHGSAAASAALAEVAAAARKQTRRTDRLGRWKEDEFAMTMTEVGLAGAQMVSERLRQMVHTMDLADTEGKTIRFSIKAGVAEYVQDMSTDESLVQAAEDAMT